MAGACVSTTEKMLLDYFQVAVLLNDFSEPKRIQLSFLAKTAPAGGCQFIL